MKNEFRAKERFLPRDLSWLKFNDRVLHEALDKNVPLLERLRFIAIFVSNLDEFIMVRMADIKRKNTNNPNKQNVYGVYQQDYLNDVMTETKEAIDKLYMIYQDIMAKDLKQENIVIEDIKHLSKAQKSFVKDYFASTIYPVSTPLGVDAGHPFPVLPSRTLAFAVSVKRKGGDYLAILPIPNNIPRVLKLPSKKNENKFILIEDIIRMNLGEFFKGYKINETTLFRIIRDSELDVDEETTQSLLKEIEGKVKKRTTAQVIYLEVEKACEEVLLGMLCDGLSFNKDDAVYIDSQFDLTYLNALIKLTPKPELCYCGYTQRQEVYDDIFEKIREGDFMLHVPYDSFQPTVDLIQAAARDENVLAIKMTLYRTNNDSTIISALKEAAANNKKVTILVEIKARFDEENNIRWARELELMGCHIIYGIPGLKVHSKMTLIVRKEEGVINRYVHLSTGNYNENTAKVYTDIGYFTCNEDFARDISDVFNVVTGYSTSKSLLRVINAPDDMRDYLTLLIDREIKFQKKHKNGAINIKMNSLEDVKMIDKLYEASRAGVKIKIIVRGICCLIPGIKGLSENIKVRSIVGRFLEHSRVFEFHNNGSPRYFLSSADWMKRNLDRRIELLFEIYKEDVKVELKEILNLCWKDNVKSWEMGSDREYRKYTSKNSDFSVQDYWISQHNGEE